MEALGIDFRWFLFQLGNFVVLFVGLTYLLHKPLLKLLSDRKEEIRAGLENAEKAKMQLATTEAQRTEMLEQARRDSAALLAETKKQAAALEEKLRLEAADKAAQLEERTKQQIADERDKLRHDLKAELADMVVEATSKVLGSDLTTPEKKKAVQEQITKIAS